MADTTKNEIPGIGIKSSGTAEEVTNEMRLANGVPQQKWKVTTFHPGKTMTVAEEWRDVPQVTE